MSQVHTSAAAAAAGLTENDGHENYGHKNYGPKMTAGREVAGEQTEF